MHDIKLGSSSMSAYARRHTDPLGPAKVAVAPPPLDLSHGPLSVCFVPLFPDVGCVEHRLETGQPAAYRSREA